MELEELMLVELSLEALDLYLLQELNLRLASFPVEHLLDQDLNSFKMLLNLRSFQQGQP